MAGIRQRLAQLRGRRRTGQQQLLELFGIPTLRSRGRLVIDLGAVRAVGPLRALSARERRVALERGFARFDGLVLVPVTRGASVGYVKDISTNGVLSTVSGTSLAINVDVAPTTATDAIVVEEANDGSGVTVSSVTDSRGNTWTRAASGVQSHAGSIVNCEIWFTNQNAAALQLNDTITINYSAATSNKCALAQEYTPSLTVDQTQNFPSASSTTAMDTGTTAATTVATEIAIAAYGIAQNLTTWTKNASYSLPTRNFKGNGVSRTIMASYQVLAATGTQGATATAGTAGWSVGVIATFIPGSPPAGGTATLTGSQVKGATITCATTGWSGTPTTYDYLWQTAAATDPTFAAPTTVRTTSGTAATSDTYSPVAGDVNRLLRCQVTAHNGSGASAPANSNTDGPIAAMPPQLIGYWTQ